MTKLIKNNLSIIVRTSYKNFLDLENRCDEMIRCPTARLTLDTCVSCASVEKIANSNRKTLGSLKAF